MDVPRRGNCYSVSYLCRTPDAITRWRNSGGIQSSLSVLRVFVPLQVLFINQVINRLFHLGHFGRKLLRDGRGDFLHQSLMLHRLYPLAAVSSACRPFFAPLLICLGVARVQYSMESIIRGRRGNAHLSSLHQPHDCRLVDKLAVLVHRRQHLGRLVLLFRLDGDVNVDPDLFRLEVCKCQRLGPIAGRLACSAPRECSFLLILLPPPNLTCSSDHQ